MGLRKKDKFKHKITKENLFITVYFAYRTITVLFEDQYVLLNSKSIVSYLTENINNRLIYYFEIIYKIMLEIYIL